MDEDEDTTTTTKTKTHKYKLGTLHGTACVLNCVRKAMQLQVHATFSMQQLNKH